VLTFNRERLALSSPEPFPAHIRAIVQERGVLKLPKFVSVSSRNNVVALTVYGISLHIIDEEPIIALCLLNACFHCDGKSPTNIEVCSDVEGLYKAIKYPSEYISERDLIFPLRMKVHCRSGWVMWWQHRRRRLESPKRRTVWV
jgi:hypothetical protein